ncbi:hypothetical protein ACFY05_32065 [Microtetraspora fusca]|uniref:Helix-turn-helix domain-containing protein n=1 Tax=Microtetraspora fusca TaxID=1997 RepID=A0ABW6VHB9_MICFU
MSAHLMIVAGYLPIGPHPSGINFTPAHKLALMKICDSADHETRLGLPGQAAIRAWAGVKKARAAAILTDLQSMGYVLVTERAYRGHRTVYKAFPAAGDATLYAPDPQKIAKGIRDICPGAEWFAGVPAIPTAEDVKNYIDGVDGKTSEESTTADPSEKGPAKQTHQEGSSQADPSQEDGSNSADPISPEGSSAADPSEGKGPLEDAEGSTPQDPFSTSHFGTPTTPLRGVVGAHARAHEEPGQPHLTLVPGLESGHRDIDDDQADRDADAVGDAKAPTGGGEGGKSSRKSRQRRPRIPLPENFPLLDEMRAWAAEHAPALNLDREHMRFCNFWWDKADTKDGKKSLWGQTWENWMLSEQTKAERYAGRRPARLADAAPQETLVAAERLATWWLDMCAKVGPIPDRTSTHDTLVEGLLAPMMAAENPATPVSVREALQSIAAAGRAELVPPQWLLMRALHGALGGQAQTQRTAYTNQGWHDGSTSAAWDAWAAERGADAPGEADTAGSAKQSSGGDWAAWAAKHAGSSQGSAPDWGGPSDETENDDLWADWPSVAGDAQ